MKHFENTANLTDRRTFLRGIGILSAVALTGCSHNAIGASPPQVRLASDEQLMPPLVPPSPERADVHLELEQAWQEIIDGRPGRIDTALYDSSTGQISHASSPNAGRFKTASIIKLAILEKLLMDQPDYVRDNIDMISPMITVSDNIVAQKMWDHLGGSPVMQEFFNTIGAGETISGPDGNLFSTATTAAEQLMVINNAAYSAHMRPDDAALVRDLLRQVAPDQRWGVSGGVPSDVIVELKNGWVDERRNSIGHISGHGIDYTLAVLTDEGPDASTDIETIELLSAKAWQMMSQRI